MMNRTDGSHSSSNAYPKAGGLFRIIQAQLHRRDDFQKVAAAADAGISRNALQFPQSREKLLVNIVEPTVAEKHDHVFLPEHRNDSVHNRVRILLVKRGPASPSNLCNDLLRFQAQIFRDLFEPGDLRDENTVGYFEHLRELLLKHRTPSRV